MKRLTIEISEAQHQQIKMLAAYCGQSLKDFILTRVIAEHDETEYLTKSTANKKILDAALKSDGNNRLAFDDTDELRNALGI